jgi:hypothetical protein
MTWRKSDWLRVRRGRESRLHAEAASRDGRVLGKHALHTAGGYGLLCQEQNNQSWQRDSNLGFTLYGTQNHKGHFKVGLGTERSRLRRRLAHLRDLMRRMRP